VNLLKMLIVWSMVAVFSFLLSRWLGTVLSPEINSVILIAAGAVATLTNAASFQVLRRLDEPPTKDLSPERAERVIISSQVVHGYSHGHIVRDWRRLVATSSIEYAL